MAATIRRTALIFLLSSLFLFRFSAGVEAQSEEEQKKVKVFMQVGALEKKEGDRFLLRRVSNHLEFYMEQNTPVYIREQGNKSQLTAGAYLVIKGPRNSNTAIANAIYIYKNKEEYEAFNELSLREAAETGRVFNTELRGVFAGSAEVFENIRKGISPILLESEERNKDGSVKFYLVSEDEETYWVINRRTSQSEMEIGNRLKLFFDRSVSIRIKNYPVKVIIDKVKAGF